MLPTRRIPSLRVVAPQLSSPLVLATVVSVAVAGCGGETTQPVTPTVAQVVVTPSADTLITLNDTRRFTAVARDASGNTISGKRFTWASTATSVAMVDTTGLVTAVGNGTATITARVDGVSGSAAAVVAQEVATVALTPARDTLGFVSDTVRFTAQARDANGNAVSGVRFVWLSSDPAVVSMDTMGLATARAWGGVTVTAVGRGIPGYASVVVNYVRYQAVTVGGYHACGLTVAGKAYCWGMNDDGQLGNGESGSAANQSVPVPVLWNSPLVFTALSAGGTFDTSFTCGVTSNGSAWCWGDNTRGQLGDSSTVLKTGPVLVKRLITFQDISAGVRHTCGVNVGGLGFCWGANDNGQLGDGSVTQSTVPVNVSQSGPMGLLAQISAGRAHTCAVSQGDDGWCWGSNSSGQLGDSSTAEVHFPVVVRGGTLNMTQISAGADHTCGRGLDLADPGSLHCWGANANGQLGDGTLSLDSVPVFLRNPLVQRVASGVGHTCAVAWNYDAYCWGWGQLGQLGNGGFEDRRAPVAVLGGLKFAQVDSGELSSCGVVQSTGEIYCWGDNIRGQLGSGIFGGGSAVPVRIKEPVP